MDVFSLTRIHEQITEISALAGTPSVSYNLIYEGEGVYIHEFTIDSDDGWSVKGQSSNKIVAYTNLITQWNRIQKQIRSEILEKAEELLSEGFSKTSSDLEPLDSPSQGLLPPSGSVLPSPEVSPDAGDCIGAGRSSQEAGDGQECPSEE